MKTTELNPPTPSPVEGFEKPVILIEHLYKSFGNLTVLNNFNLVVNREENVVVLGKSGSGKSVLIKCIIGLLKPESGNILVFGENVPELAHDELDRIRTKIGFLFQGNALYDSMTVRENLEFPLRRHWIDFSQQKVDELVMEALNNVGLPHTVDMMPAELSGGMLKRVALARTLILKPEIILYDEPTTGLDPVTAREIDTMIISLQKKYHTTSIIISHDMNCVKNTADRVVLLAAGKCYAEGTYAQFEASADENIKQFFE
ncbi:phospholipid/cholesterol/gamma-HCH transport system ATP-binding protein [Mucilaginibacter gracilis]|uniref:Phospholipid/cholesterol/gamma-HCH transport system ATP-binding protein n=1 Tax=Mucilaginibacter gracilis TaxID=423350 RepID=A0A495J0Y8_9SPHI|nr:ATP-binding cassette domain-containing protein [Mucilaginibacter gracilis]RKR81974.1 phospholipid/cholesterol/gamma-HCH transport system ATP-binding protein [Mucilaginibacter gracilis]